jgi:hypothetical protein
VREGVTVDYRNIDCGNRPDPAAFVRDWDRTIVTAIKPLDPRLTAVTAALNKSHVNGGAKVAQLEIEAIDAVAWVLARNRLSKYDFFRHFFERAAVVKAFPEAAMPTADIASFEAEGIPTAIETLSRVISGGGAYRRIGQRCPEACAKLLERRQQCRRFRDLGMGELEAMDRLVFRRCLGQHFLLV